MANKTGIAKLAKRAKRAKKTTPISKTDDNGVKERVERLVDEVNLSTTSSDDLFELDDKESINDNVNLNNVEWLQEQLEKLSKDNETLKNEAEVAKAEYKKIFSEYQNLKLDGTTNNVKSELIPDSELKNNITELFMDVQNNFQGRNPEKTRYSKIIPIPFMTKMVKLFPFLAEYKRF